MSYNRETVTGPAKVFFTADTHFGHARALEFEKRPFVDVDEHDSLITDWFCEDMPPGSTLYHLGDLAWTPEAADRFLTAMERRRVRVVWIRGNHDHRCLTPSSGGLRNAPLDSLWLDIAWHPFRGLWLSHYPHLSWPSSFHGSAHLFGHVHGKCGSLPPFGRMLDVGLMNWNFRPLPLEAVLKLLDGREASPV